MNQSQDFRERLLGALAIGVNGMCVMGAGQGRVPAAGVGAVAILHFIPQELRVGLLHLARAALAAA